MIYTTVSAFSVIIALKGKREISFELHSKNITPMFSDYLESFTSWETTNTARIIRRWWPALTLFVLYPCWDWPGQVRNLRRVSERQLGGGGGPPPRVLPLRRLQGAHHREILHTGGRKVSYSAILYCTILYCATPYCMMVRPLMTWQSGAEQGMQAKVFYS